MINLKAYRLPLIILGVAIFVVSVLGIAAIEPQKRITTVTTNLVAASGFEGSTGNTGPDPERPPASVHDSLNERLANTNINTKANTSAPVSTIARKAEVKSKEASVPVIKTFGSFKVAGYSKVLTLSSLYQDDIKALWHDLYFDENLKNKFAEKGVNVRQLYGVYHNYQNPIGTVQLTIGYVLPQTLANQFQGRGRYGAVVVEAGQYKQTIPGKDQNILTAWSSILGDPTNLMGNGSRYWLKTDFERYTINIEGEVSTPVMFLGVNEEL